MFIKYLVYTLKILELVFVHITMATCGRANTSVDNGLLARKGHLDRNSLQMSWNDVSLLMDESARGCSRL